MIVYVEKRSFACGEQNTESKHFPRVMTARGKQKKRWTPAIVTGTTPWRKQRGASWWCKRRNISGKWIKPWTIVLRSSHPYLLGDISLLILRWKAKLTPPPMGHVICTEPPVHHLWRATVEPKAKKKRAPDFSWRAKSLRKRPSRLPTRSTYARRRTERKLMRSNRYTRSESANALGPCLNHSHHNLQDKKFTSRYGRKHVCEKLAKNAI